MPVKLFITIIAVIAFANTAFAEMELFVSEDCPHCKILQDEMNARGLDQQFKIQIYDIYSNSGNRDYYIYKATQLDYKNGQVPLLVDGEIYKEGTLSILEYLETLKPDNAVTELTEVPDSINEHDSAALNQLLKAQTKESTANIKLPIGIVIMLLGLTILGALFQRAKKRK